MTLLDRIKSLLGLGSTRSESTNSDVDVAVDDSPPDHTTDGGEGGTTMETEDPEEWGVPPGYDGDESDVQAGPEAFADAQGPGDHETEADSAVGRDDSDDTAGTDLDDTAGSGAGSATRSDGASGGAGSSTAVGIEEAEATAESDPVSTDTTTASRGDDQRGGDAVTSSSTPIEEAESDEADADTSSTGPDLTDIKGIGPAYEQRLIDAGVSSVDALVEADTASLADSTDLSETRVGRWQDRAAAILE
ncbi:helix-hairpin-helix domain-containing protein [Halococcoides cellulosivorans]|uniref:Helix-hairpin-helix domain-containing protein n=1 Tax=Halococcoides cellulosivorans TaxID=1679096 RepID=A0A2R4X167_9EURY|nr:helix-hairpin-helix domain-containing protein [Halococcoides cellulosivorans]AWB27526.1 hypothetical protein HARCEL1_07300 [Halococcoides cellulosivorans]